MTHHEFNNFLDSIKILTPEQLRRLSQELASKQQPTTAPQGHPVPAALAEAQFKQDLLEAGLMTCLPTPPAAGAPELPPPLELDGEPLSETIIRERR